MALCEANTLYEGERARVIEMHSASIVEKRHLEELVRSLQGQLLAEREAATRLHAQAERVGGTMRAELQAAEAAGLAATEALAPAEAERCRLASRCSRLEAVLKRMQGASAAIATERRWAEEVGRRQEGALQQYHLERSQAQLADVRMGELQRQREMAEGERASLKAELAELRAEKTSLEESTRCDAMRLWLARGGHVAGTWRWRAYAQGGHVAERG